MEIDETHNRCKSAADARLKLISAGAYLLQLSKDEKREIGQLKDENVALYGENKQLTNEVTNLQVRLSAAEVRANEAELKAKEEERKRCEAVHSVEKERKIVLAAKTIAGFTGHVGWPKYLKATEELKKAVEESESAKLA